MVFANDAKIVYVHSVYAIIEVKTTLNSNILNGALDNFMKIREMEHRTKFIFQNDPNFQNLTRNSLSNNIENHPENHCEDILIHKFIFAYKSSMTKDAIIDNLREYNENREGLRNKICICILQFRNNMGDIIGSPIDRLDDIQSYGKGENTLLAFYRTVYNTLCIHDKVENGTLNKTKSIIRKYNPWGL